MDNDIGNALKYYRELRHMTQAQLAEKLGITQRNVSYYESGERIPPADVLKKIAILFNISVDYLLGLKKYGLDSGDCSNLWYEEGEFNWYIRRTAEAKGISYEQLTERTEIDPNRMSELWWGKTQPIAEELIRISTVLDVSIDYLLDMSQREKITPEEDLILRYYHNDPENVMFLLESFCSLNRRNQIMILGQTLQMAESIGVDSSDITSSENGYPSSGTEGPTKKGA
ncbi:MAG: helix-turn-helix domain-containing protein [Lachnospiraceae bacterium]|nr:helix-turn-helix domain-containing protein [Lachnospiraceae bacterium]